jgi:hypothetical protein
MVEPTRRARSGTGNRRSVCFSAQADLAAGVVVGAIGVDALRHIDGHDDRLLLAGIPLLLGAHQLVETFVWWGGEGLMPHAVGRAAMWGYLVVALVVLPIAIPVAVRSVEPSPERRRWMLPFALLGLAASAMFLDALVRGPVDAVLRPHHVAYEIDVEHAGLLVAAYVVAVCAPLLASSYKHVVVFGCANLVAVVLLALATAEGFTSLWCAYAAVTSGAIALHLRHARPRRGTPELTVA